MCRGSTMIVPIYHSTIAACNQQKLHFNVLIFFWANTLKQQRAAVPATEHKQKMPMLSNAPYC